MKATLTRNELLALRNKLEEHKASYTGVKLAYAVAKNLRKLTEEVENIQESIKAPEEVTKYLQEVREICLENCLKDGHGEPIPSESGQFQYETDELRDKTDKAIEALRDDHPDKDKLDEHDEKLKEFDKFLQETCEIELHAVKLSDLNDDLNGESIEPLVLFIEE